MQRSIMSFFQPTKEGKAKKPEKETAKGTREAEPPPKAALKERNGVMPESDSPVKRPGRRVTRVLGSEEEEEDGALTTPKSQQPAADSPPSSPSSPVRSSEGSPPLSSTSPMDISPSGFPKRRTARKQLPKRTILDVQENRSEAVLKAREAKKRKKEVIEEAEAEAENTSHSKAEKTESAEDQPTPPPEAQKPSESKSLTGSASAPEVAEKQEAKKEKEKKKKKKEEKKEEEEKEEEKEKEALSQPPPRAPKTLSSFFTPRKPATKKEAKEEGSGALVKEDIPKGALDPSSYNPAKNNYHPVEDACWKPGQK